MSTNIENNQIGVSMANLVAKMSFMKASVKEGVSQESSPKQD